MTDNKIFELHVNPTYAVCVPQRMRTGSKKSLKQLENEENLKDNQRKKGLSKKAIRRLTNAVNWLVASAKSKYVFDRESGKRYNFKINFVTLTIPTLNHEITDHEFKSKLMHNFINTLRASHGLKNYVWKVEAQENGNIHAHFTTDTFIHWRELRSVWNRILSTYAVIDKYHEKHKNLSFESYCKIYNSDGKKDIERMRKAFDFGVSTDWREPNTTDVHAVWKVADVAAYLAKYMGKNEVDKREIKGRLWSCSYKLSEKNKLIIELHGNEDNDIIQPLMNEKIKWKTIEGISALTGKPFVLGEMFFFKMSHWGTVLKGRLLEFYNKHRFDIRYNIDSFKNVNNIVADLLPAENVECVLHVNSTGVQSKVYF